MPIPTPKADETQSEFVSRCISDIYDEYGQEKSAAICYNTYRKSKGMSSQSLVASKLKEEALRGINLLAGLEKGPNDPCWSDYVQVGTKVVDGKEVPNCVPLSDVEMELESEGINLADYSWETCILEQTDRYGSKDIAEKVCGMIRSKYGS